jgi:transcription antitermination protein NusB
VSREPQSHGAPQRFSGARSVARKLALQALYRWQLNDCPWQDLVSEFADAEDMPRADHDYFRSLIAGVVGARDTLETRLAAASDREARLLDPIEHAILLIGLYELEFQPEVPFRTAINEAVQLARRFGATDGYKFVNAVLDRAARTLRPAEH